MNTTRRDFAIMGAGSLLSGLTVPSLLASAEAIAVAGQAHVSDVPWYRRVKRTGQTNFNERDPQNANVEQWADYWASTKVQALALSVSGPVAFYPTKIPYFHRSSFLGERDLFGECVKAAKVRGIRIYGRMSPDIQWMDPKLIAEHPLWFRHNQDGSLQSSAPDIAFTCQFGGHFAEQQPAIIRELNANYDIDGLYMNGWPTMQVCYCENCRKIGDPHSVEYKAALMASAADLINLYKRVVVEKSPNNFYSCNLGGGLKESGLDQWKLTREALWYTADNQSRASVIAPVWQDAQQVKFALALMGQRPVAAVSASYARAGAISWRNVTDTSAEPECRMAQTAAAGGIVWYHWLGLEQGFQEDRRWQSPGREFLAWHAKHDRHFHNVCSLARVAIVVAPKSVTLYDAPTKEDKTDSIEGMYSVLVEARIPFDFLHEEDLTVEHMRRYAALILPNVALLSNAQCRALEQYVDGGGSLLATFETSLYDDMAKPREDFALGELFGIKKVGVRQRSEPKSAESMTSVHLQSLKKRNALTAGFDNTEWIAGPVWSIPLAPVADPVMTTIQPYPVYPPEAVYTRQPPSDSPSIVMREKGQARLVYLAGDMDASYWRLDSVDLGRQLSNAVRWILRDEPGTEVVGQGLMEVCAWETESGFTIHMLNYNGPNAFRGRMRTPVPLGAQAVRVVLPRDVKVKAATLLTAETAVKFQQQGRTVRLTVPAVKLYEVVALEV